MKARSTLWKPTPGSPPRNKTFEHHEQPREGDTISFPFLMSPVLLEQITHAGAAGGRRPFLPYAALSLLAGTVVLQLSFPACRSCGIPCQKKMGRPSERACRYALFSQATGDPRSIMAACPQPLLCRSPAVSLLHLRFWPIIQRCNILCSYSHGFSSPSWQSDTGAAICNPDALSAGPLRTGTSVAAPQCRCGALCVRPHILKGAS